MDGGVYPLLEYLEGVLLVVEKLVVVGVRVAFDKGLESVSVCESGIHD